MCRGDDDVTVTEFDHTRDPLLERMVPALASVPGIKAIVLGGSRARGTAKPSSDYDLGLYTTPSAQIDTDHLLHAVRTLVDEPEAAEVTSIGEWGPWIVGGAWLTVAGRKVDLLYRNSDAVAQVIESCRSGHISMNYQPGHPHGFCSAIWMGEIALCQPLHDPERTIAELKSRCMPYPKPLRDAIIRRFQWEILFSIENGELAATRADQTHVAGCAYRALACTGQVLFALNERYLINEKGALEEAATLPATIPNLMVQVAEVWRLIGSRKFGQAFDALRTIERELRSITVSRP
jgi:predicted nucleotidyltransferase